MTSTLPAPSSVTSCLRNCKKVHFYCVSHPVCGIFYGSPSTQVPSLELQIYMIELLAVSLNKHVSFLTLTQTDSQCFMGIIHLVGTEEKIIQVLVGFCSRISRYHDPSAHVLYKPVMNYHKVPLESLFPCSPSLLNSPCLALYQIHLHRVLFLPHHFLSTGVNGAHPQATYPSLSHCAPKENFQFNKISVLTAPGQSGTCPLPGIRSCYPTPTPRMPSQSNATPSPLL